jgi:hypothetical protein
MAEQLADEFLPVYDVSDAVATAAEADATVSFGHCLTSICCD